MTAKRRTEEVDDTNAATTSPAWSASEADELLRDKLLATHEAQRKHRCIYKRRTINLSTINPTLSLSGFIKLDRELRDQIYQIFWSETPQINQRYKRRFYDVTYSDVPLRPVQRFYFTEGALREGSLKYRIPWLLTGKQIKLEGFAEFHQRSVWYFEMDSRLLPQEYIFPLMTPALVREHHFRIQGLNDSFATVEYLPDDGEASNGIEHVISPKPNVTTIINLMTASAEAHDAVPKFKFSMVFGSVEVSRKEPPRMPRISSSTYRSLTD